MRTSVSGLSHLRITCDDEGAEAKAKRRDVEVGAWGKPRARPQMRHLRTLSLSRLPAQSQRDRLHTPAYVSIRQHTSTHAPPKDSDSVSSPSAVSERSPAYASIRQRTPAYASITSADASPKTAFRNYCMGPSA